MAEIKTRSSNLCCGLCYWFREDGFKEPLLSYWCLSFVFWFFIFCSMGSRASLHQVKCLPSIVSIPAFFSAFHEVDFIRWNFLESSQDGCAATNQVQSWNECWKCPCSAAQTWLCLGSHPFLLLYLCGGRDTWILNMGPRWNGTCFQESGHGSRRSFCAKKVKKRTFFSFCTHHGDTVTGPPRQKQKLVGEPTLLDTSLQRLGEDQSETVGTDRYGQLVPH